MKKINEIIILFLLFSLIAMDKGIQTISISVNGNWSETIDSSDLQAGPGSDLNPTYTSDYNLIDMDIKFTLTNWRVGVRKVDTNWPSDLRLGVRRTSNGIGIGSISGGTSWVEVTDDWKSFFTGSFGRWNVDVQLGLTGMSVQIPPDTYITTIYYGVEEI